MFLGSRARPERKADNLTAIYKQTVQTMWYILNISQVCEVRPGKVAAGLKLLRTAP
jgi:hypothetical protein